MHERRAWIVVALGLVAIAAAVRFAINFSSPIPPGIDAAYYPLQTRHWLTHGRLMYDDLPLIFWLNAAVTKVLVARGWELDHALMTGSRLVDCLGPPWMAAFVMALGYAWSGGRRSALPGCAAAAILIVLGPAALTMLSEFQKNSLGLVWMTASVWACVTATRHGGWIRWTALAVFLVLSVLTHIGAFAATAITIGLTLFIWIWRRHSGQPAGLGRALVWLTSGGVILAALFFAFDPRRFTAFITAPSTLFGQGLNWGHRNAGPAVTTAFVVIVVAAGLYRLWRDRRDVRTADAGIVIGIAVTSLVLVGPSGPELTRRLCLMAWAPATLMLTFVMARRAVDGRALWPSWALLASVVLLSALSATVLRDKVVERSVMTVDTVDELRELRGQIHDPDATLIIATHGHEWWAGYLLHTPVRVVAFAPEADNTRRLNRVATEASSKYRRVLYVRQIVSRGAPGPTAAVETLEPAFRRRHTNRAFELYEWRTH
jgi:hypothetical protein